MTKEDLRAALAALGVRPGDLLMLEVVPLRKGGAIWKLRGEAKVDGVVVAEAELLASIQP